MSEIEQTFPNITLKVRAGLPQIELRNSEDQVRVLLTAENIDAYLAAKAKKIGFTEDIEDIYNWSRECDEEYLGFDMSEGEISDSEKINYSILDKGVVAEITSHKGFDKGTTDVNAEVGKYWQGDVLASVLDGIYTILTMALLEVGAETGTELFQLDLDQTRPRMLEKVSLELQKTNAQLTVL